MRKSLAFLFFLAAGVYLKPLEDQKTDNNEDSKNFFKIKLVDQANVIRDSDYADLSAEIKPVDDSYLIQKLLDQNENEPISEVDQQDADDDDDEDDQNDQSNQNGEESNDSDKYEKIFEAESEDQLQNENENVNSDSDSSKEEDDQNIDEIQDLNDEMSKNLEKWNSIFDGNDDSDSQQESKNEIKFDWIVQQIIVDSEGNPNRIDSREPSSENIGKSADSEKNLMLEIIKQEDEVEYLNRKISRIEALVWWTLQLLVVLSLFLMVCHFLLLLSGAGQKVRLFYVKPKQTNANDIKNTGKSNIANIKSDCCEKQPLIDV